MNESFEATEKALQVLRYFEVALILLAVVAFVSGVSFSPKKRKK